MIELKAKLREVKGRKVKQLKEQGMVPAVLYGAGIKNLVLEVEAKEFERVFKEAGESLLIKLKIEKKEKEVLIHQIARDPVSGRILHVDFYHPSLTKEVTAEIPLVFEKEAPAVNELSGTLIREIQSLDVKGLAHKLPREIKVDVSGLKRFEDRIKIKDIDIPEGLTVLRDKEEIVASVAAPREEREEEVVKEEKEEKEGKKEEKEEEEKEEKKDEK